MQMYLLELNPDLHTVLSRTTWLLKWASFPCMPIADSWNERFKLSWGKLVMFIWLSITGFGKPSEKLYFLPKGHKTTKEEENKVTNR